MKPPEICVHRYELELQRSPNSRAAGLRRAGALLKVAFDGGIAGYADCHPWPELGDAPLDAQLAALATGTPTTLGARSLDLALSDANARARGTSLFEELEIPPSHFLALDVDDLTHEVVASCAGDGFDRIKVKVGRDPAREAASIAALSPALSRADIKLRLDCNARLDARTFEGFLDALGDDRSVVDFFEDPIPFEPKAWRSLRARHGLGLAVDRIPESVDNSSLEGAADVLVLKPATQDPVAIVDLARRLGLKVCVTTSMDHPVGQMGAAWVAARLAQEQPGTLVTCGLLSHRVFDTNAFSRTLRSDGRFLRPTSGSGVGFDALLDGLSWTRLS